MSCVVEWNAGERTGLKLASNVEQPKECKIVLFRFLSICPTCGVCNTEEGLTYVQAPTA
jgi:hypothetical protein